MTKGEFLEGKGLSLAYSEGFKESEADPDFQEFINYILERAHCANMEERKNETKDHNSARI